MATHNRSRKRGSPAGQTGVKLNVTGVGRVKRADVSHQLANQDEIWQIDGPAVGDHVIRPPYQPKNLATALEISNILRQCIYSYVVNIASFGYRVVPRYEGQEVDPKEKARLESFVEFANTDESLSAVEKRLVHDYEHYGFAFMEVIRNKKGSIGMLRQLKAAHTRLLKADEEVIQTQAEVKRGGSSRATVTERKRFRRFLQQIGNQKSYYKEFGDPRRLNYKTGEYATESRPVAEVDLATEVIHIRQYSEDSYGIPRWISHLPNIIGSREAEEVNMRFFEDNTVPPALLTVSGGRLTRESFQQLKEILEAEGVGKARAHKILLIEAVPETAGIDEKGQVKVQLDKLVEARQSDALFAEYDKSNRGKIRSSFRLPPALIGESQDVTFATANVSVFVAETQVFLPERRTHDEILNKKIVHHPKGLDLDTVKLESRGPTITNPEQLVKSLTALSVMGGLTPRGAVAAMNEVLDWTLENYPEKDAEGWEEWMDTPVQISTRAPRAGENGGTPQSEAGVRDPDIDDAENGNVGPRQPENGSQ